MESHFLILLIFTYSIFLPFFVWSSDEGNRILQKEIDRLRDLYGKIFNTEEVIFEGMKVYKEDTIVSKKEKKHVTSYSYVNSSGEKIKHGMVRLYCDKEIIMEGMYSKGFPDYYMIYNFPKETLQVIFKDGKPDTGIFPVVLHNAELLGLDLKNGVPLKATIFKRDGTAKEIIFDVSKNESKNGQPWNGEFLSVKNRKIDKYIDGKMVSSTDCENLTFIENILESFNRKNKVH